MAKAKFPATALNSSHRSESVLLNIGVCQEFLKVRE